MKLFNCNSSNFSLTEFLNEVKEASVKAIDNQAYPIGELIKRLDINISSQNPLTDIMLAYQSEEATDIVFGDNKAEILPVPLAGVKCDINFTVMPRENDAVLMAEYSTDIFKESTVSEFIEAYKSILESALDEIYIQYENLASSCSTIKDADIAQVSSTYIQQQILQQASATLMATANQAPAIALQLI
jgi:non-ribosomal peptide synthetase component F